MARPVIAWLTDFGTRDHYVGVMKGVALSIAPDATLVDITHDVEPQDVLGGALELAASYPFFPSGTIFVAIVDPGVGSTRKAIAVNAGNYTFVAPDNGVLSLALAQDPVEPFTAVELTERRFSLPEVSRTFEGRDRFAPAAAWLACGVGLEELGNRLPGIVQLKVPGPQTTDREIRGEVLRVDRFGNAITNIARPLLDEWHRDGQVLIEAGSVRVDLVAMYSSVAPGTPCALFSSSNHLEIAVADGSALQRLGLTRGSAVVVRKRQ